MGRRNLHDSFVGLDRNQRLIGDDVVARGGMPRDDLGFRESLAEIRKVEQRVGHA